MKLIGNIFGVHEKAIGLRNQRMEILARNIANSDTPHFKARELDFKAVLSDELKTPMRNTNQMHFSHSEGLNDDGMRYRVPFSASTDGNTVEVSVEQSKYGKASADYQTTLMFLENKIAGIRKSLKGE